MEGLNDIGGYYQQMHGASVQDLRYIKGKGIELGHAGVVDGACERLGEKPTRREYLQALYNAARSGDHTIDDPRTSAGWLYQSLFGRDFYSMAFSVEKNGMPAIVPYSELVSKASILLPSIHREILAMKFLEASGYRGSPWLDERVEVSQCDAEAFEETRDYIAWRSNGKVQERERIVVLAERLNWMLPPDVNINLNSSGYQSGESATAGQ
ncbi:MAG: hypothetical protein HY518_02845 [Candidatus Aenigmarchaeota archaeon]|nr:hypothetical protein [Candidatus Aenigmarchaeota archaeon]